MIEYQKSFTCVGFEDLLHASGLLDLELHLLAGAVLHLDGDGLGLSLVGHDLRSNKLGGVATSNP